MKGRLKGFSLAGLIVVLVVVAVAAVVLLLGFGGFGFGGGKGDGEGDGDSVSAASPEETEEALPVIEEIEYINITVSENEYLYQNSRISLDELINELTEMSIDFPVKITDENASLNAYRQLLDALDEHNIKYIEESMN